MTKCLIVDDEPAAREVLERILQIHFPKMEIMARCQNLEECVTAVRLHRPEVVFLDIEMPGESGLNLFMHLNEDEIDFIVVFITAHPEYALNAFKLSAIDYLLKPLQVEDLRQAMAKIALEADKRQALQRINVFNHNFKQEQPLLICIPTQQGDQFLNLPDLIYMEADGAYTKIYLATQSEALLFSKNIKHFENLLNFNPDFMRVHRSFLVNLRRVQHFSHSRHQLTMSNNCRVSVSRERVSDIDKALKNLKNRP